MEVDLLITGGIVIDGSGRGRFNADVAVSGGRIVAIVQPGEERPPAAATLDAAGKIVAPGFIDMDSHADWIAPLPTHAQALAPLLLQGVTTAVGGNCGYSAAPVLAGRQELFDGMSGFIRDADPPFRWGSVADYLDNLRRRGLSLSLALLAGQNTLRQQVMRRKMGPASGVELAEMEQALRRALREGAVGFSGNLGFSPGAFAGRDEILALLRVVAEEGGVFPVHARVYTWISRSYGPMLGGGPHDVRAVRELVDLVRESGVRLHVSHIGFGGRRSWRTHAHVLEEIDRAAERGLDIGFDAFAYPVGGAPIQIVFPEWFLEGFPRLLHDPDAIRRLKRESALQPVLLGMGPQDVRLVRSADPELAEFEGLDFQTIGRQLGMGAIDAQVYVARHSAGRAMVLIDKISAGGSDERALRAVLSHPLCAFATNAFGDHNAAGNPAFFGNFPRVLGHCVREAGWFPLEEAVRRMTSYPAERMGLTDIGRVREGFWGDLCLFDPATVGHAGWPGCADEPPTGISAVLVSGEVIAQEGRIVSDALKGRLLTGD